MVFPSLRSVQEICLTSLIKSDYAKGISNPSDHLIKSSLKARKTLAKRHLRKLTLNSKKDLEYPIAS